MASIQDQHSIVSPEGVSSKLHISDHADFGSGSFVMQFGPRCFLSDPVATSVVGSHLHVQIAVTIMPNRVVMAALRYPDGIGPIDSATFLLPSEVNQDIDHTLTLGFEHWRIYGALFDDSPLARQDACSIAVTT